MRLYILAASLILAAVMHAEVVRVPLKSGLVLKPNEAFVLNLDTAKPEEIGWTAIQAHRCSANCVQMKLLSNPTVLPFASAMSAIGKYSPTAGKLSIEYRNISSEPVTIDIFRVQRTCTAEACRVLNPGIKGRPLTFKIAAFKSITTSKDESYSVISGTAMSGRPFTVRAIWWTDDQKGGFHCNKWIKIWLDTHAPPEKYSPYILSGLATGEGDSIVLSAIDDCVPHAPNFSVPEDHVFK